VAPDLAKTSVTKARQPGGGRSRPGRQEAVEPEQPAMRRDLDQAATRRLSQIVRTADYSRAGSGGHKAAELEGERGGGAGSGGAPSQEEMMKRRGTGFYGAPVIVCAKQRNGNPDNDLVR
jgi:hypothetical protein